MKGNGKATSVSVVSHQSSMPSVQANESSLNSTSHCSAISCADKGPICSPSSVAQYLRVAVKNIDTLEAGALPLYFVINEGVMGSLVRWDRCRHSNALVHVMSKFRLSPHAACFSTPKAKRRAMFLKTLKGFARDVLKLRCNE